MKIMYIHVIKRKFLSSIIIQQQQILQATMYNLNFLLLSIVESNRKYRIMALQIVHYGRSIRHSIKEPSEELQM